MCGYITCWIVGYLLNLIKFYVCPCVMNLMLIFFIIIDTCAFNGLQQMNSLYRFWSYYLRDNFNESILRNLHWRMQQQATDMDLSVSSDFIGMACKFQE